eukprot:GHVU01201597.1.p2 GENE.GHVU01201597.1~~GHVU01201597.1.p2  ORF type:complete len:195 (-),score=31.58 GHVU01201597.1:868-1452(-)
MMKEIRFNEAEVAAEARYDQLQAPADAALTTAAATATTAEKRHQRLGEECEDVSDASTNVSESSRMLEGGSLTPSPSLSSLAASCVAPADDEVETLELLSTPAVPNEASPVTRRKLRGDKFRLTTLKACRGAAAETKRGLVEEARSLGLQCFGEDVCSLVSGSTASNSSEQWKLVLAETATDSSFIGTSSIGNV